MIQLCLITIAAVALVGALIHEQMISRRLSTSGYPAWEQVLYRLKAVRSQGLREVASQSGPSKPLRDEATSAYSKIGGKEGLRRLAHNAPVIADLASCSLGWTSSGGVKMPAVGNIRWAVVRLRVLARVAAMLVELGASEVHTYTCLQKLASMYCKTVEQLIQLYSEVHEARVDQLVAACNW